MKKNTSIKIIGLSTLFATALMVGSTLSWLAPTASMENAKNPNRTPFLIWFFDVPIWFLRFRFGMRFEKSIFRL